VHGLLEAVDNLRGALVTSHSPGRAPGSADSVADLVGNTPLVRLNRVAEGLAAQVAAKCEFLNPGGSVKDRIGLAMILDRNFRGKGLVRMAALFPWALPTALNALMWRWMFNTEFGLFNSMLSDIGLIAERINWLGAIPSAMHVMMFVSIWKTSSFMALLLLAGLQTIPDDLYEAGSVDGTTRLSEFRFITLPLLKPAILVSVLLRTRDAMRAFELPFNLTDGGPLTSTETLSLYAYRAIFQYVNFNLGSSAILIQFIIIMTISVFYILMIRRGDL